MLNYVCTRIVEGFQSSISSIGLSCCGRYVGIGTLSGILKIVDLNSGKELVELSQEFPVTALLWHPLEPRSLFVGYGNGILQMVRIGGESYIIPISRSFSMPVVSLDYYAHRRYLGVATGEDVHVLQERAHDQWKYVLLVSKPFIDHTEFPVEARSLHWITDPEALIICYLNHGILCFDVPGKTQSWHIRAPTRIAFSAFSARKGLLALANLYDGFTVYTLNPYVNSFDVITVENRDNIALPVQFIHNDEHLLFGSPEGHVGFTPILSDRNGHRTVHYLPHDGDDVQAIAYLHRNGKHVIATGNSQRGNDTRVRIWTASTRTQNKSNHSSTSIADLYEIRYSMWIPVGGVVVVLMSTFFTGHVSLSACFERLTLITESLIRIAMKGGRFSGHVVSEMFSHIRLGWIVIVHILRWMTAGFLSKVTDATLNIQRIIGDVIQEAVLNA